MTDVKNILEIQDLWKSFSTVLYSFNESIPVLKGVSMDIEKESITALIGGNGAGKTTLLNIINGFLSADRGTLSYRAPEGKIVLRNKQPQAIAKLGIGRLFQGTRLFTNLTVQDNLLIACNDFAMDKPFVNIYAHRKYRERITSMTSGIRDLLVRIDCIHFLDKWDQDVGSLSYADQRILNLITLLLGKYKLVLLDEPTSGMNVGDWEMIEAILNEMKGEGISIFLIEHNMEFVKRYVKTCYYMSSGKIIVSGKTDDVLNNPIVKEEYLALC